jgi:hypothetical protein
MEEWGLVTQTPRLRNCMRRVLGELHISTLIALRREPKLEVIVAPDGYSVWAYFPIHRGRLISRELHPKPETKVLLVFGVATLEKEPVRQFEAEIRDHLGHVLLYLRSPKAKNDCPDAMKEWRRSIASA